MIVFITEIIAYQYNIEQLPLYRLREWYHLSEPLKSSQYFGVMAEILFLLASLLGDLKFVHTVLKSVSVKWTKILGKIGLCVSNKTFSNHEISSGPTIDT